MLRISSQKYLNKGFFICLALLVFSGAKMSTAFAQSCSVNCLRVYSISLTDHHSYISATVKLADETGAGAGPRGTTVRAVWSRPDGSSFDQYARIGTRMRASFRLYNSGAAGTYTLTVVDATKNGYTFDATNSNILNKNITVGNVSNQPPKAVFNADVINGSLPLTVNFDSTGSIDQDGAITNYRWDFGDGGSSTEANPTHIYTEIGNFIASLTITDDQGAMASTSTTITVSSDNEGCVVNCMSIDRIAFKYWTRYDRIRALVWVVDESNSRIRKAVVHARWTLPDGSEVDQYRNVGTKGRAAFILPTKTPGTYKLTVIQVTKPDYTFDPDSSNVLDGMIKITN